MELNSIHSYIRLMKSMLKTPRSAVGHHTVGQLFKSNDGKVWYCDSADDLSYYFTNVKDLNERRNVDPGEVTHEYHLIYLIYEGQYMCALGLVDTKDMSPPKDITWSDYWPDEEFEIEEDLELWLAGEEIDWDELFKKH